MQLRSGSFSIVTARPELVTHTDGEAHDAVGEPHGIALEPPDPLGQQRGEEPARIDAVRGFATHGRCAS